MRRKINACQVFILFLLGLFFSSQKTLAATPDQITGLNFWLKADAGIVQSGGKVSTWQDQSISANNATQASDTSQPTFVENSINSLPSVRFTGAPVTMGFNNVNAQSIFIVYKDNGTTDDFADILGDHLNSSDFAGDVASSGKIISSLYASPSIIGGQGYLDGTSKSPVLFIKESSFHIYEFIPTSSVTFSNIANNQDQPDRFMKGDYAEIITFEGALNDSDRYVVENYLSQKYGISVVQDTFTPLLNVRACADGDSVTAYPNNYVDGSPGGYYQSDIQSFPNVNAIVSNVSVSGQSQAEMLADINSADPGLSCKPQNPDIWTLTTSLNDISDYKKNPSELRNNIISYVNAVLAMKNSSGLPPQLILMTDNMSGQNLSELWARPWQDQYDTAHFVLDTYNLFANNPNVHIVDNFTTFYGLGVDTQALYDLLLPDQVHPNQEFGYAAMHNNFQSSIVGATTRIANPIAVNGETSSAVPGAGRYVGEQNVTLTIPSYAAFTYYTLDGTSPDDTKIQYTGGTISVSGELGTSKTLKVVSYDANGNAGSVFSAVYDFGESLPVVDDPVVDPIVNPVSNQGLISKVEIRTNEFSAKFKDTIRITTNKFKLKQQDPALANGTIKIFKGDDLWETVVADVNGAWSKTLRLGNNAAKTIKLYFYDTFGSLLGMQKAKIKVDTSSPKFKKFITPFYSIKAGETLYWEATDNVSIRQYKVYFNGRKTTVRKARFVVPANTRPGLYTIVVKAYDSAGNSSTKKTQIRVR